MNNSSFVRRAVVLASFALAACGGKTSDGSTPVPRDQFITSFAHAICDGAQSCCTSNGFGYDANSCLSLTQDELNKAFADPTLSSAVYDDVAAGRCLAAVRDAVQSCSARNDAVDVACGAVFHGTKALGETCSSSVDCAPPADGVGTVHCLAWSTSGGGGTSSSGSECQLHLPPSEGAPCGDLTEPPASSVHDCGRNLGFYCGSDAKCHALAGVGAACVSSNGCIDGASCDGTKCVAGAASGAHCDFTHGCDATSHCDTATSTCAPKLANGGTCGDSSACASGFCVKSKCVSSEIADAPTCVTH